MYICIQFVNVIIVQIFYLFIVSKIENILMIIIYKNVWMFLINNLLQILPKCKARSGKEN